MRNQTMRTMLGILASSGACALWIERAEAERVLPSIALYAAQYDVVRLAPDAQTATSGFQVDVPSGKHIVIRIAASIDGVSPGCALQKES